jgi:tetratricopeptide (TPR) repeat protein
MRSLLPISLTVMLTVSGCALEPFKKGGETASGHSRSAKSSTGAGPVLSSPPEVAAPSTEAEPAIAAPPSPPLPRERPRAPAATLSPASKALVSQAQAQRKKGDLPGATVALERALRIEPNNPLLWIEMGRLRMDQQLYAQAENMGRKALAMSISDDRTQSMAWQLIADSLRARGKNGQAEEAVDKARALTPQ